MPRVCIMGAENARGYRGVPGRVLSLRQGCDIGKRNSKKRPDAYEPVRHAELSSIAQDQLVRMTSCRSFFFCLAVSFLSAGCASSCTAACEVEAASSLPLRDLSFLAFRILFPLLDAR